MITGVSRTRSGPTAGTGSPLPVGTCADRTTRSPYSNVVYDSPWPNANSGTGSTELPGWRSANRGRRYEDGWPPGSLGSSTGSRPLGTTRPDSNPGDRAAALLPREERLHGRGELPGQPPDRVGPAGHQHQHDRLVGRDQDAQQVLLHAGQSQLGDVAALTGGAPAEQAGLVSEDCYHHVGLMGVRGGVREV